MGSRWPGVKNKVRPPAPWKSPPPAQWLQRSIRVVCTALLPLKERKPLRQLVPTDSSQVLWSLFHITFRSYTCLVLKRCGSLLGPDICVTGLCTLRIRELSLHCCLERPRFAYQKSLSLVEKARHTQAWFPGSSAPGYSFEAWN